MKTGDEERLVQALEEAAILKPDFVPLLKLIGEHYESLGEWDKTVQIYAKILEMYPGDPAWLEYEKKIISYNENKIMQ